MHTTKDKILTVMADEMTKTTDVVEAAWNACHRINAEAVAAWGPQWDEFAFSVAANVIRDSLTKAAIEVANYRT